jgi:hypothetical protein
MRHGALVRRTSFDMIKPPEVVGRTGGMVAMSVLKGLPAE